MTLYPFAMTAPATPTGMRREMDRLVQDVFGTGATSGRHLAWAPAADATEDAEGYTLVLDVPGIAPDQIELMTEDGMLVVRGSRPDRLSDDGVKHVFAERATGSFERRFRLPKHADVGAVEARYSHGVLTVRIAKVAPAQPRRLDIAVESGQA
ncbi:MAG: Hsp20/alpha crystallin family protein [Gemmatimonadota bacterium]